jgi:methionyl-tRNA formyltransferase
MPPFRAVFMGTPTFAVSSLIALAETEEVVLVVTNPDRPAGRGQALTAPPVKVEALRLGIPVFQPEKAKHPDAVARVAAEDPDLIVVAAYGHILPKTMLDIPRHGCINVHASVLPKYRGAAPVNWAIARGETVTGITIMKMDVGMDTGPILHVREIPIGEDDTAESMTAALSVLGAEALREALEMLHRGALTEIPQDDRRATYAPMLRKEHGRIDWAGSAKEVRDLIRGMFPWPSAYTFHRGRMIKILDTAVSDAQGETVRPSGVLPGTILAVARDGIAVACGEGNVRLTRVRPEGGKEMSPWAYAQGRSLRKGEVLSPTP